MTEHDMVNHPPHYTRGPVIRFPASDYALDYRVEAIEVIRHIRDHRISTAMKYLWRVGFGGKWSDHEDIREAIFYLNDYLEHPVE